VRSTAKHSAVTVLVVGRTIAWKAIGESLDERVFAVLVPVSVNLLEEWLLLEEWQQRGLDSRFTTKHGGGAVVVVAVVAVGRAIAWKVTDVS